MKRIPYISFIRVLAMLSIILGHYLTMIGIYTYQLLSIGVEIFLFISGFIYGKKHFCIKVNAWGGVWFKERWKKLILPMWITIFSLNIVRAFFNYEIEWFETLICLLNLQGISRVFINMNIPAIEGMEQTWFVTVIFLCYIIMFFLQKFPHLEEKIITKYYWFVLIVIFLQICFVYCGIQLSYIIQFFIGYFCARIKTKSVKRTIIMLSVLMLIVCFFRILSQKFIDGTVFYNHVIARLSFNVLSIWLIANQILICNKCHKLTDKLITSKIWNLLDKSSYYLFLSHYMFCVGAFAVNNWSAGFWGQVWLFTVLTLMSTTIIMFTTNKVGTYF